jgi:hypothetical protein
VIIDHLPSFAQRFFRPFQSDLSKPQFVHLWSLVLGLVINLRSAKLVHLAALASADGHLSRIGHVRMVVSKRPRGPWKKCIARVGLRPPRIVTNELGLKARRIVEIYERRWLIERTGLRPPQVLFKELVQDLGLGDYQMLQTDGIVNHLHVCCLAHQLLTHHTLQGLGDKAKEPHEQVKMPTMNQRLASLRERITREGVCRIMKGPRRARLRSKLLEHLLPAA